jgi:hypothetical protein
VDLADSADHGQVPVAVADVSLRTRDADGQPLAVLHGNEPVLAAMPDLNGHPDVAEIEPPPPFLACFIHSSKSFTRGHGAIPGFDLSAGSRGAAGDGRADGRGRALYRLRTARSRPEDGANAWT